MFPDKVRQLAFLHIGKNAGTQIMHLAEQLKPHGVVIHQMPHTRKLYELPPGAEYFFSIRDPISRFRSGFYSRKRKGQPRLYVEWSSAEAAAFARFEHASELAEALFRDDETGRQAMAAIQSVRHTAMQQIDWFERAAYLDLRPPVWIIRQENFSSDFDVFLERLGLSLRYADLKPALDATRAHRNDYSLSPPLSRLAEDNLRRWYARDFAFYDYCVGWMAGQARQT